MKQLSDYTASTHEHRHVCPFCDEQLKLENDSERPKFTCSNTNCRLITCYCNGTIKESTVNRDTLFTYIKEEYNRSPENVIQNIRDDSITDPFATKIIELLQKRDLNKFKQAKETGERVMYYNSHYVPWSQLLRYTIVTDAENDFVQTALCPLENARLYSEQEIELFVGLL